MFLDFSLCCFLAGEMSVLKSYYGNCFSCRWVPRFPVGYCFFFCFSYIQVYAFLWPSDVALFFFLHCLSCWLLHHQFSLFFLSPLPLLLSLFSLFSDVFFGGVISFRFYRFLGVACVVYFVLNLLPFG